MQATVTSDHNILCHVNCLVVNIFAKMRPHAANLKHLVNQALRKQHKLTSNQFNIKIEFLHQLITSIIKWIKFRKGGLFFKYHFSLMEGSAQIYFMSLTIIKINLH